MIRPCSEKPLNLDPIPEISNGEDLTLASRYNKNKTWEHRESRGWLSGGADGENENSNRLSEIVNCFMLKFHFCYSF